MSARVIVTASSKDGAGKTTSTCWRKSVLITLDDGSPIIREYKFLSAEKK